MTSRKPYLLRALQDWIVDNQMTPYLLVDATLPGQNIPARYVKDGRIIFNLSPSAVQKFQIAPDAVSFEARFGGVAMPVYVPIAAVLAIYARENGQGFSFQDEAESPPPPEPETPAPSPGKRAHLKVIK